MIRKPFCGPST